jgi:hypothetical protein
LRPKVKGLLTATKKPQKSLADGGLSGKVKMPNENWALRRVLAALNVCRCHPAVNFSRNPQKT